MSSKRLCMFIISIQYMGLFLPPSEFISPRIKGWNWEYTTHYYLQWSTTRKIFASHPCDLTICESSGLSCTGRNASSRRYSDDSIEMEVMTAISHFGPLMLLSQQAKKRATVLAGITLNALRMGTRQECLLLPLLVVIEHGGKEIKSINIWKTK